MYTKAELREGARVLLSAMKYLETACRDQDVDPRPWVSGDHPLSTAHWIMAQCRFKIASLMRSSRSGDPEGTCAHDARIYDGSKRSRGAFYETGTTQSRPRWVFGMRAWK